MNHSLSKTFKLVIIRLALIIVTYVVQRFFTERNSYCPFSEYGNKFLSLILTDFLLCNLFSFGIPFIRLIKYRFDFTKPKVIQFDVSNEVVTLCYRQFLIYLGMTVFPLIVAFGFVFNIIEFFLQKIRLCKLCYETKRSIGFMNFTLPLLALVTILLASFAYPNGIILMLMI